MRRDPATDATLYHFDRGEQVEGYLHGQVDLSNCDLLRAGLDQMLAIGKNVMLHADDLEFMDLCAARVILAASEHARGTGRNLHVANPRPTVRRLLVLLGMNAVLRD